MLASAGAVGLGIALPFHGDRYMGIDPALVSFNYFNATAGRSNFRQATLEQIWLIETLTDQGHHLWGAEEDQAIDIQTDPYSVAYMGHSHGGELSIAAPFIGHKVQGVVLSGAGGGIPFRRSTEQLMTTPSKTYCEKPFSLKTTRNSMNSTLCWA